MSTNENFSNCDATKLYEIFHWTSSFSCFQIGRQINSITKSLEFSLGPVVLLYNFPTEKKNLKKKKMLHINILQG